MFAFPSVKEEGEATVLDVDIHDIQRTKKEIWYVECFEITTHTFFRNNNLSWPYHVPKHIMKILDHSIWTSKLIFMHFRGWPVSEVLVMYNSQWLQMSCSIPESPSLKPFNKPGPTVRYQNNAVVYLWKCGGLNIICII